MQKIATDIYTFERLRKDGFTYVDKTAIIYEIANSTIGAQFFVARPRRFGKSLAVSTFHALFEGRRDLFRGLAIDSLEWNWDICYPILHLDMGSAQCATIDELCRRWRAMLAVESERNGITFRDDKNPATAFENVILDLAAKSPTGQMVLLVDEYDKPMLRMLNTPEISKFRDTLKQFYSVVKTLESKQRFMFMTGVSRFSKVSIFSDLNNLIDMTMNAKTATMFGFTHEEVKRYFGESIDKLAEKNCNTPEETFDQIVWWYDGYRFHHSAKPVINPVSLGCCLRDGEFNNYWSTTATPTFLIETLKKRPLNFASIDIDETTLGAYEPENPRIETLLFQTGYLTIDKYYREGTMQRYTLKFPNAEVASSFGTQLVGAYTGDVPDHSSGYALKAIRALNAGDAEEFVKILKLFFFNIPYDLTDRQNEQTWQAIVFAVLHLIGVNVGAEVRTATGRIDMTVVTPVRCYVVEFKLDRPAVEAIAQIRGKGYAARYVDSGKPITIIGLSFSSEKRTIVDSIVEEL